ncbi:MAG: hypothetical protein AAFO84_00105 [Cyanobacteria bacterium J06598_1]
MAVAQWISGPTRSGRTQQLIEFAAQTGAEQRQPLLVFAANGDNRIALANRLTDALGDSTATLTTSPAGFIQDEIILFWPLLVQQLDEVQAQFPLKLRPENEQVLATELWQSQIDSGALQVEGWRESRIVRRSLDFLQLASQAGVPIEDIPAMLKAGMPGSLAPAAIWDNVGAALVTWQNWCLQRGLLTYGIMSTLYWRHLLPMRPYQLQLFARFKGVLADDVDEYPAISAAIFSKFIEAKRPCLFTYNPQGKVRLGLGADPDALRPLAARCEVIELALPTANSLGKWGDAFAEWVEDPLAIPALPEEVSLLQATSRGQMLRTTAEAIARAIESGQVHTDEIAVIGPGLDAIGRYSLIEILSSRGIALESLNDQRPLVSSPMVRALLSLLALVYPGLGRLVDRDAIAEMLVVISQSLSGLAGATTLPTASTVSEQAPPSTSRASQGPEHSNETEVWFDLIAIDPVRAELIADNCFVPDIENPHLLPVETFARWDRLGYQTVNAYQQILKWIDDQQRLQQQRLALNPRKPLEPITTVDRIIQDFLWRGNRLPYDQLATLRELMETAQYFWEVEDRLKLTDGKRPKAEPPKLSDVGRFIQLIQKGTVSANPYPVNPLSLGRKGVTLSTIYQYRAQRLSHRWQFWLDAGSPLWESSAGELFGAPLFLQSWPGRQITLAEIEAANEANLNRTLHDLLGRATEKVLLCHSELALTGQEQMGPLLSLVGAAQPADESLVPAALDRDPLSAPLAEISA